MFYGDVINKAKNFKSDASKPEQPICKCKGYNVTTIVNFLK